MVLSTYLAKAVTIQIVMNYEFLKPFKHSSISLKRLIIDAVSLRDTLHEGLVHFEKSGLFLNSFYFGGWQGYEFLVRDIEADSAILEVHKVFRICQKLLFK